MAYAQGDLVEVFPFTQQVEGTEVVIGRPETGTFLALPLDALEILDSLATGRSVGEAQAEYARVHGETPDIADLLEFLEPKGFVRHRLSAGGAGEVTPSPAALRATPPIRYHFTNIHESTAQRFFGPTAVRCYLLISALGLLVATLQPSLVPSRNSLYFFQHQTAKLLLLAFLTYLTVFIHEFCHLLAARATGAQSRIGLSNRLWILVAETDMTNLWAVPRGQRYLPMLAGPLSDCVSGSLILFLLLSDRAGLVHLSPLIKEMSSALLFSFMLRLLWQFFFFVRTDIYFVIANFFGCKSLMKDTQTFLKNQVSRFCRWVPRVDQGHLPTVERRVVRVYSVLWFVGRCFAFYALFFVTLPVMGRYLADTTASLRRGFAADPYQFIDTVVVSSVSLIPFGLGMAFWLAALIKRRPA